MRERGARSRLRKASSQLVQPLPHTKKRPRTRQPRKERPPRMMRGIPTVRISDAPDIRPDNPAFYIAGIRPDTRLPCRISGYCLADPIIYLVFLQIRKEQKFAQKLN
jgi:hypothetical protein